MKKTHCIRGHERTPANLKKRSCRLCMALMNKASKARIKQADPIAYALNQLKRNAKHRGLEFSITKADLAFPTHCPVLGMELDYSGSAGLRVPNAASVDRVDSSKGYIPGNVVIMSVRANHLKNDATPEEIRKLAEYMAGLLNREH